MSNKGVYLKFKFRKKEKKKNQIQKHLTISSGLCTVVNFTFCFRTIELQEKQRKLKEDHREHAQV